MILVTGNRGYIGTVMTKMLKEASYKVVGLDNDWYRECYFFNSEEPEPHQQIIKDVRTITDSDLNGITSVIHLAALSNDPVGEINPTITQQINSHATLQLAKICKKKKIKKFIFASSCSIYGMGSADAPISEEGALNPLTAYAKAKVNAENQLRKLADEDFCPVLMRNATVYGSSPKIRLDLVVNHLVAGAYLTGKITVMSDGLPWRPLIHIQDFCRAFMKVLEVPSSIIRNQILNVGDTRENYRIKDIALEIQKVLPQSKIEILNKTSEDERTYRVDFSKIKEKLNFKPQWNLRKGIEELVEDFKKNNLTFNDFKLGRYFRIQTLQSHLKEKRMNQDLFWL